MRSPSQELSGRVAVVTGGTSGVGYAFAEALAGRGATVALLARNEVRGAAAADAIRQVHPGADVACYPADLADVAATRDAVARVRAAYPAVHVVGTMAGVYDPRGTRSPDGHEIHLATNVLSAWITVTGLRDALLAAAPSRVVLLAGNLHLRARFDPDDVGLEGRVGPLEAAKRTMLYKVALARELARRTPASAVSFNAVCPGFTRSGLLRHLPLHLRALGGLASLFAHSPERGAETAVALATAPEYAEVSGRYFRLGHERAPNPQVADPALGEALCRWLAARTGGDWPPPT